jgi:uncharacterized protein with gpF-like domain
MRPGRHYRVLRPVHPNAGIQAEYRRKLRVLVREMATSYEHWLVARYRENPPAIAMDALPAKEMIRELAELGVRWDKRLDEAAPKLARWFAQRSSMRSSDALRKILADAGLTVRFNLTREMRDAFQATLAENVGLIRSIGSEYHTQVEGMVMRSVSAGRDLATLKKDLQARYAITDRRANLIARDQNNKSTAVFVRVRQQEMGLKAVWLHSHGGKTPRPTHVANNGKLYDPVTGWLDPAINRRIWPGTEINCRCVSKSVVKGFS